MKSFYWLFLLVTFPCWSQQGNTDNDELPIPYQVDSMYREDQFYIGLSFNLMTETPATYDQNGFSGGLHLGFIRDMPINKDRDIAIGVGLGFSTNTYNTNLFIGEEETGESIYRILSNHVDYDTNRFNTNIVEIPIQFRWRTSTPSHESFWRVYTGIKLGYVFHYKARFEQLNNEVIQTDIPEFNRLRYAATLTLGNGSFNAFVQWNLNPMFNDDATVNGNLIRLQPLKFGIEFYLL